MGDQSTEKSNLIEQPAADAKLDSQAREEVLDAFVLLREGLDQAFKYEGEGLANERERYAAALGCLAKFVSVFDPLAGYKFFDLGSAIADLNEGRLRPLLRKQVLSKGGRSPFTSDKWRARAYVAIALSAFMKSGLGRDEAAATIALKYPILSKLAETRRQAGKDQPQLRDIISGWRHELSAERVSNFEGLEVFKAGETFVNSLGADPKVLRTFATDQLERAIALTTSVC